MRTEYFNFETEMTDCHDCSSGVGDSVDGGGRDSHGQADDYVIRVLCGIEGL